MTDARQVETELVSIVQTGESFHAKGQYDSRYLTTDWRVVNPTTPLTPQGPIGKSNFHLHWPLALGQIYFFSASNVTSNGWWPIYKLI